MDHFYRVRMGSQGRLGIPKKCRTKLGFRPGQELLMRPDRDGLHLSARTWDEK
jgi:AbrB family looped-hinge helix DNA binding protein